jgi:transglutaminase-like putative cysteine protease
MKAQLFPMRLAPLLIFFLIIPAVCAQEDYQHFGTLQIESVVEGIVDVKATGANPQVKNLAINVTFYPKKTPEQELISSETKSGPDADEISVEKKAIRFFWEDVSPGEYEYNITRIVKKINDFRKVRAKVKFPPAKFNTSFTDYLQPTEFIDINEDIRKKASELAEGETDYYRIVFKIAEWVEKNVYYDLSTITAEAVQKSSWVMTNKKGVCDELTNLYISMLRSLGIPARFIAGQVYTSQDSSFGNHGWAEVYFPGEGWIPVDVTFGQFGWIGPSHVAFKSSLDSGEPSAEYTWKAKDAKINIRNLNISSRVIEKNESIKSQVKLKIETLTQKAAPQSYVPLQVTITNPHNNYVPLTLYVTKAPGLEENNRKPILLRPLEKKTVFWTIKVPEPANPNAIYKAVIEAVTGFGANATTYLLYGYGYNKYDKKLAEEMIKDLETKEQKDYLPNVQVECSTNKPMYYATETARVKCKIKNTGNTKLNRVRSCIKKECKANSLTIGEEIEEIWRINLSEQKVPKAKVTVESGGLLQAEYVSLRIVWNPKLKIDKIIPTKFDYKKKENITIHLKAEAKAKDVSIRLKKVATISMDSLEGTKVVTAEFNPKRIRKGKIKADIRYKDELGKEYIASKTFDIEITNIPWYMKIINYILV